VPPVTTVPRPAFGNGPLAKVIVAFLVGAFVVIAAKAYDEQARAYEAAPQSVKAACAGRLVGDYRHCVVREDAARRAAEQQ
jgi:hypothetical protein